MKFNVIASAMCVALGAWSGTCTWTGAENGFWTNANNWAEGGTYRNELILSADGISLMWVVRNAGHLQVNAQEGFYNSLRFFSSGFWCIDD